MSIDAPISRFGPADGAAGHRGPHRPGWDNAENSTLTQNQSMSFWDFLDIINPLQHLPIISLIYREVSGDEISPSARVMGGALYGGPIGLATGAMDAVIHQETGNYAGGHVMTAMFGGADSRGGPDAGPGGADSTQLALGPVAGQQVGGPESGQGPGSGGTMPALSAAHIPAGGGGTSESSATSATRATVIVQRDGSVVHLDDVPPAVAPTQGARHYETASRLDLGPPSALAR